jgi:predicted nuclease of predicted toxin-antitoxin system
LRLLLDEQQDPAIAQSLRREGSDVIAVAERPELREIADAEVLAAAVADRRAVLTEDVRDFTVLHRLFLEQGQTHYGIILTSRRRHPRHKSGRRALLAAVRSLLGTHESEDALRDQLIWLSEGAPARRS